MAFLIVASLQWQLNQFGYENDGVETGSSTDAVCSANFNSLDDDTALVLSYTDVSITQSSLPYLHQESAAATAAAAAATSAPSSVAARSDTSSLNDNNNLGWGVLDWTTDGLNAVGVLPGDLLIQPLPAPPQDSSTDYGQHSTSCTNMENLPPIIDDAKISPSSCANNDHMMLADQPMALAAATPTPTTIMPGTMTITDDIRADLDQIYMERVHPILPILYWKRFLSWADQANPDPARACLRSAMRTMAAAMSASSTRYCDQLYAETRALLRDYHHHHGQASCSSLVHQLVSRKRGPPGQDARAQGQDMAAVTEYIQAWLLVGHFELLRVGEHQAVLTAGRCCRLVMMARLFQIDHHVVDDGHGHDDNSLPTSTTSSSFSDVEERRRTFWVAFCLDRLLCSRNEYPLTFQEEMVSSCISRPPTPLSLPSVLFRRVTIFCFSPDPHASSRPRDQFSKQPTHPHRFPVRDHHVIVIVAIIITITITIIAIIGDIDIFPVALGRVHLAGDDIRVVHNL